MTHPVKAGERRPDAINGFDGLIKRLRLAAPAVGL
jgi:hypothetical protein